MSNDEAFCFIVLGRIFFKNQKIFIDIFVYLLPQLLICIIKTKNKYIKHKYKTLKFIFI